MAEWQSVVSSNISAVKYDEPTNTLSIRFNTGAIYDYAKVPPDEYQSLVDAGSVGNYFHDNIRNMYPAQRVG